MPNASLRALYSAIASGDETQASRLLRASPAVATEAVTSGATRASSNGYFLAAIEHYIYAGDTALHIAAAAYRLGIARKLVSLGANPSARNRLGAEPLHYASVGGPGSRHWNPEAQAACIEYLIAAGANPNAADKMGATPLHRAVRTRCAEAVQALLTLGADARARNRNGSTPLHLAVYNTGRGGSGGAEAKQQQDEIVRLLIKYGAKATDTDARGRSSDLIRRHVTKENR
jgi:ankyrin repeat protein